MKHSDLASIDQLNIGFDQLQDQGTLREVVVIIIIVIIIIVIIIIVNIIIIIIIIIIILALTRYKTRAH